jgi:broad specificity phosphatase PhoE
MIDFHSLKGTADFIFTRHGESESNKNGIMQGRLPSLLTETGRAQARETGRALSARPPEVILTSPLTRARETAEIIAEETGTPYLTTVDELTETDIGIFTNMSGDQARVRFPAEWNAFLQGGWETVPGAEKCVDLAARAHAAWKLLIGLAGEGKRSILSVTHSGFLQWIIRVTMGLESWMPLIATSRHCGITILHVDNHTLPGSGRAYYANWTMINLPSSIAFPAD